jgi:cytochrome c biogenesis protein CcmG, thiol:disulfide interchange protein DsbE
VKVRVVDSKGKTRLVTVKLTPKPAPDVLQRSQLIGKPAPDFEPAILSGLKLPKISALKGKVVLIDFWATWCGPCILALPHLEKLHQELGAKGLTVLGVSTESSSIVSRAAAKYNLTYSLASDENEGVSASYGVFALPTAILIDKKGIVREVSVNDHEALEAAIAKALK